MTKYILLENGKIRDEDTNREAAYELDFTYPDDPIIYIDSPILTYVSLNDLDKENVEKAIPEYLV